MTGMPDLIAKTRIFDSMDRFFNTATTEQLLKVQDVLKQKPLGDVLIELVETQSVKMVNEDLKHILNDVFGRQDGKGWWESYLEEVTTEAFAQLIQHMVYIDPFVESPIRRKQHRCVDTFWICPVTFYYRCIITRNPDHNDGWINFLVMTPPKKDHDVHYKEYEKRHKTKEKHDKTPVLYKKAENIWVTSLDDDNVKTGKKEVNGEEIDLSIPIPAITKVYHTGTVQLLAEEYHSP